jgi:hypothetical protein
MSSRFSNDLLNNITGCLTMQMFFPRSFNKSRPKVGSWVGSGGFPEPR